MRTTILSVAVAIALAGCMMGPNYKRPTIDTPAAYRVEVKAAADLINSAWWEQFQDPVLNELIKIALAENKDVRIAASRVEEFLGRYRAAQVDRVARIDAIARQRIAEQRLFQDMISDEGLAGLSESTRTYVSRRAFLGTFIHVYRTDANPSSVDLSITPSKRDYGSIITVRPDLANYTENGFAKTLTPKAWLSLWSGLSSRTSLLDNLPKITVPTLVVTYTGDNAIYPVVADSIFEHSPAADKSIAYVDADHFGFPLKSHPEGKGREEAGRTVATWLKKRFRGR